MISRRIFCFFHDRCQWLQFESTQSESFFVIFTDAIIFDMTYVNKGRMLYATPQHYSIDHFVIIISTSKGNAICFAPFNYFTCVENQHLAKIIMAKLMHDIKSNPGPIRKVSLKVITLNCRGLGDIDKFRLLLN